MESCNHKIHLGFTNQEFEPGAHICQIFSEEDERHDLLYKFLVSGLENGEKTICFTERESISTLEPEFRNFKLDADALQKQGAFSLGVTDEVYFANDEFNPDKMLELLKAFYTNSMNEKYSAARVIGEMTPRVNAISGGSRLLEYESKVSMLQKEYPVTAICQYDAHAFDGATIMEILKVHPLMVLKGEVIHNPFFIPPEEYLKGQNLNV